MKKIAINGETKSVSGWAKCLGISRQAFHRRLKKQIEGEDLLRPRGQLRIRQDKYRGHFGYTIKGLAMLSGLSEGGVRYRIKQLEANSNSKEQVSREDVLCPSWASSSKYKIRFGYTLVELSKMSGIPPTTISWKIKQLDTNPGLRTLYKILLSVAMPEDWE